MQKGADILKEYSPLFLKQFPWSLLQAKLLFKLIVASVQAETRSFLPISLQTSILRDISLSIFPLSRSLFRVVFISRLVIPNVDQEVNLPKNLTF